MIDMASPEEIDEQAANFMDRMKMAIERLKKDAPNESVSYPVFIQTMDFLTENMMQVYSLLHQAAMEKTFTFDFRVGDVILSTTCGHDDIERATKMMEKLAKSLADKILDPERLKIISKIAQGKQKDDQSTSLYG